MQAIALENCHSAIADFLSTLERGLKASVLYPSNSSLPREFRSTCWNKLCSILGDMECLDLEIAREEVLCDGQTVYRSDNSDVSVSGILHRDGLRRIRIGSSIVEDEFAEFFRALHRSYGDRSGSEDIVNLLWELDLDSIEYHAVDDFVIYSDPTDSQIDVAANQLDFSEVIAAETAIARDRSGNREEDDEQGENQGSKDRSDILQMISDVHRFTPEEKRHILETIETDRAVAVEFTAIDLLFDIALSEESYSDFNDTCDALDNTFSQLFANENIPLLVYTMRRIRDCIDSLGSDSKQRSERMRASYFRCGDRIRISKLADILNRSEDQDLDPIRSYLEELDWSALTQFVWLLGELELFPARKMVCDLLVRKGRTRPDFIASAIYDSRWYVARNAASILGKIGSEKCIAPLRKAVSHDDERVRWEAVSALCEIDDKDAVSALIEAIDDGSERIRLAVIKKIIETRLSDGFDKVKSVVDGNAFDDLTPMEKREFLKAYAVTGQGRALDYLKKLASAWRPFGGERAKEIKEYAVYALGHCLCDGVVPLLEKWSGKSRGNMKVWASRAMSVRNKQLASSKDTTGD